MNERIKKLAHQADLVIKKSNGNDFRFGAMDPKLKKFAELIVRECIDIAKDVNRNPYLHDEDQARQIIKNITKRFGVKE